MKMDDDASGKSGRGGEASGDSAGEEGWRRERSLIRPISSKFKRSTAVLGPAGSYVYSHPSSSSSPMSSSRQQGTAALKIRWAEESLTKEESGVEKVATAGEAEQVGEEMEEVEACGPLPHMKADPGSGLLKSACSLLIKPPLPPKIKCTMLTRWSYLSHVSYNDIHESCLL